MEYEKSMLVFYSWQSDTPSEINQRAIRTCIREAINKIENGNSSIHIQLDEATRKIPGSPDIPNTIFDKIKYSDIFICDITTINQNSNPSFRKVPNPNVLIELGFAVATLGWDRIIMLFNKSCGEFPNDIPFDIGKRRILDFSINAKSDNNGKGQLRSNIIDAINLIIEENPEKSIENSLSSINDKRDVIYLNRILSTLHFPTIDNFLENGPSIINGKIFHFWHGFQSIYKSSLFYLNDKIASRIIDEIYDNWETTMSYAHRYFPSQPGNMEVFSYDRKYSLDEEAKKDLEILKKAYVKLRINFSELVEYIRDNYVQIDLDRLSQAAYQEVVEWGREFYENLSK